MRSCSESKVVSYPFHEKCIPSVVESSCLVSDSDENLISTLIAISLGRMQRLMDIANEVREEHQCHRAIFPVEASVFELSGEVINALRDALLRTCRRDNGISIGVVGRRRHRYVDEVPVHRFSKSRLDV